VNYIKRQETQLHWAKNDMPRKPREVGPVTKLALRFYSEVLGHKEDFTDQRLFRRYAAEAKRLCNPTNGDKPLDPEIVWATIQALRLFKFGYSSGKVDTMWCVMWGHPPYYQQYLDYLNTPPPHWNLAEVKEWERATNRIAYPEKCDIVISVPVVPAHISQSENF